MKKTMIAVCLAAGGLLASCGGGMTVREMCDSLDTAALMASDGNFASMKAELDTLRARTGRMEQELDGCHTALDNASYFSYQYGRYVDSALRALDCGEAVEAKKILKEAQNFWSNPMGKQN